MVANIPQLPDSGNFISSVRSSSRAVRERAGISIEHEAIKRLFKSPAFTTSFERVSASHGLALPLKFPSTLSELNVISIVSLLNFGSGYRIPLHNQTRRGAWDNIRAFVFSLYITSSIGDEGDLLSARGMQTIGEQKVAELMGVNVHVEKPHETIPGVIVGELRGHLHQLVKLISGTLVETGLILQSLGYPDLGSFVLEALQESGKNKTDGDTSAGMELVLERLVRALPAFRDMTEVDGQPVYCFKKALFLIHGINIRFGSRSPTPFPTPQTTQSPIFTDNVIPSMLVHLGIIGLSSASHSLSTLFPGAGSDSSLSALFTEAPSNKEQEITKEGPIVTTEQAYILRAAAIDACEIMIEVARSYVDEQGRQVEWIQNMTLPKLDTWLWAVAKDRPDYRELERFVLRNTAFF